MVHPGADGDWLRGRHLTWALLRPDRYVFAYGRSVDIDSGLQAWRRIAPSLPNTKEHR